VLLDRNGVAGYSFDRFPPRDSAVPASRPQTLGALKRSPFATAARASRTVKDELRSNLIARLGTGDPVFEGVLGYEDTVMPQIINALLSRHNFILLGLRGQAK
jgi:magnesium chelatase subunit I